MNSAKTTKKKISDYKVEDIKEFFPNATVEEGDARSPSAEEN